MTILEKAQKGLALDDVLVIDAHTHMHRWHNFVVHKGDEEGMIASMNRLGINAVVAAPHMSIGPDAKRGNDEVLQATQKYPERFYAYATVNPNYENEMLPELERCFAHEAFRGIKLHPACCGCDIDYKKLLSVYAFANERTLPVLLHVWGNADVAAVGRLAVQFPHTQFIMGHAGAQIRAMEQAIDVVNSNENVYVDLAISTTYQGNVEWFVREMGANKVLFGTDMPFFDPRANFARVAMADISDADKRLILGENCKKLMRI